jgi:uncharacterized protein (TIGR02147 family)
MPDIFEYTNYRTYLNDFIASKKRMNSSYSLEVFCRRAAPVSRSLMSLILIGKRNLTEKNIGYICKAMDLQKRESGFFEVLVKYDQAKDTTYKSSLLSELLGYKRPNVNLVGKSEHLLKDWGALAILELTRFEEFKEDPDWIYEVLKKRIKKSEIKTILLSLKDLELAAYNDQGKLRPTGKAFVSSDERKNLLVQCFHQSCLELSQDVLLSDPVEDREFGSLTLSLSEDDFVELKERIKGFLLENLNRKKKEDKKILCQLNIQLSQIANLSREEL